MPYNPDGSFSIENEIGTGYACNNALVPLLGSDLDDIAAALSQTSTVGVLSGVIAQSRNSTLLASVLPPGTAVLVMQIGPCTLKTNDLLQANAFAQVINNDFGGSHDCDASLFITTTQAAVTPAQNADRIGGNTISNESTVASSGNDLTFHAVGTAVVSSGGAYYLNYAMTFNPSASSTVNASVGTICCGINIVRYRFPLGTI